MPRYGYERLSAQDNSFLLFETPQRAHARRLDAGLRDRGRCGRATAASTSSAIKRSFEACCTRCRATASALQLHPARRPRGLGGRPALQPRLPHPPHRAAEAGRRVAAEEALVARDGAAARPQAAAVGDLGRRGARGRRPLRDDHEDPPLHDRRRLGRRPRADPVLDQPGGAAASKPPPRFMPRPAPSARRAAARRADALARRCRCARCAASARSRPRRRTCAPSCWCARARWSTRSAWRRGASETPLNGPVGPHRAFDWLRVPLAELKAMRKALDCTINDVVLTVVTGAVRDYLIYRGVRPGGHRVPRRRARQHAQRGGARPPRQPRVVVDPLAADRRARSARAARRDPCGDAAAEGEPPGARRRDDDAGGGVHAVEPADARRALDLGSDQHDRDQRARARSSRSTSTARSCSSCIRRCRCWRTSASASRSRATTARCTGASTPIPTSCPTSRRFVAKLRGAYDDVARAAGVRGRAARPARRRPRDERSRANGSTAQGSTPRTPDAGAGH